jgi:hypothetical protein
MIRLLRPEEQDAEAHVLLPEVLPDLALIKHLLPVREAINFRTSQELAWEISHRILLVQRWARYYGVTTSALTALSLGLVPSTRRPQWHEHGKSVDRSAADRPLSVGSAGLAPMSEPR